MCTFLKAHEVRYTVKHIVKPPPVEYLKVLDDLVHELTLVLRITITKPNNTEPYT